MKILDNLHQVDGVNAGAFLLIGGDGLSLVDAGLKGSDQKILAYMQGLGYQPQDLKRIFLTHADADHIGGLRALVDATRATTYAQTDEADVIAGRQPIRGMRGPLGFLFRLASPFMQTAPVGIDQRVKDGDQIAAHGGIDVIASPGHTRGHVCYYWREPRVLFVGDAMTSRNKLAGSVPLFTWDMAQAKASIKRLTTLDISVLCFGHGAPITSGAREQLRQLADSL